MDYTKFARISDMILRSFGVSATLTRKASGNYDPNTSTAPVTTTADTVKAVMFPYPAKMIDGTLVHVGDMQVFIGPDGLTSEPQAMDKFTIGGIAFTVVKVMNYKPDGATSVLYELQVRK